MNTLPSTEAADTQEILEHLYARGLLVPPCVTRLSGGVSGDTFAVDAPPVRLVVKRLRERLDVAGVWMAKPERAATEAAALDLLHGLTPEHTPELRGFDADRHTLVMTAAPATWVPWKPVLLGELADPTPGPEDTAARLGAILGLWHERTWHDPVVARRFDDYEAFDQLRITPFHRTVSRAHPDIASRVNELADELLERRDCLVHGDFSPKNVLVGPDGLMVLDFEVAHVGAAVFDLAFLHTHLILKALHNPRRAAGLAAAAGAFGAAYQRACPGTRIERLAWHVGCLLLARVDGLSPAGYLRPATADVVRHTALNLLRQHDPSVTELWDRLKGTA